ncbi:hypothetical protein [Rhizobium halophilum]|nr:hypothetical protein [Rhizobium halophilum]MCF6367310.1 hypothetical protein [Rhizobium halophilum]
MQTTKVMVSIVIIVVVGAVLTLGMLQPFLGSLIATAAMSPESPTIGRPF